MASSSDERQIHSTSDELTDLGSVSPSALCTALNNVSHTYTLPAAYKSSGSTPPSPMSTFPGYPLGVNLQSTMRPYEPIMVTLEDKEDLWEQFSKLGTEMIVAKPGRSMFPIIKLKIENLNPHAFYMVFLEIAPVDFLRYKFERDIWAPKISEQFSPPEWLHHPQSPARGQKWMEKPVDFSVKLTNCLERSNEGTAYIHSMHKYMVKIHVVEGSDANNRDPLLTRSFPLLKTTFVAVTTYQNPKMKELKTEKNIHAKGIRDKKMRLLQSYEEDLKENFEDSCKRRRIDDTPNPLSIRNESRLTSDSQVTGLEQFSSPSPAIYPMGTTFYKQPDIFNNSSYHVPPLLPGCNAPDAYDGKIPIPAPLTIHCPSPRHHLDYSSYYNPYLHVHQQGFPFYHHMSSNFSVYNWPMFPNSFPPSNFYSTCRTPALRVCPGYGSGTAPASPSSTEADDHVPSSTSETEFPSSSSSRQSRPSPLSSLECAFTKYLILDPETPSSSTDDLSNFSSSTNYSRNRNSRIAHATSLEEVLDSCHCTQRRNDLPGFIQI